MSKGTRILLIGLLVLVVAAVVRLPALPAGLPYMTYVDEGHVLHHVVHHLAKGTWEPSTYSYPPLPFYLVTGAALAYSPIYAALHGEPLREGLSEHPPRYYDILEPPDLLLVGRIVTLVFSLGSVVLTGLLARRLAGPEAGLFAAWLAALVPALVARSAIVNINPLVAFFALAALWFAEEARDGDKPRRGAVLAGLMTGFAGATKYPAALICLPVALAVLLGRAPWKEKVLRLFLAGGASLLALIVAMPTLVLRPQNVLHGLREMSTVYGTQEVGSYWDQAVRRAEWDLPLEHPELGIVFLILAITGLTVGLWNRSWSKPVWGWLLFGVATGLLVAPYKFRAFRNLLALVPLACILVALLYAFLRQRVRRPIWLDVAAVLLPVVLWSPALADYIQFQRQIDDSREQALRWVAQYTGPGDKVMFSEELAFLPHTVEALASDTDIKDWAKARDRIYNRRYHYIVLGELTRSTGQSRLRPKVRAVILANYKVVAQFGRHPTLDTPVVFRFNQQLVYILKRTPRPERLRKPAAAPRREAGRRSGAP